MTSNFWNGKKVAKKRPPSSSGSSGKSWKIEENQENPTNFIRLGTAGRLGPEILASKILPKHFLGDFRLVNAPKISKNVAPKASPRRTRRCWKMMNTSSFSSSSSTGVCLDGRPFGRHFWRVLSASHTCSFGKMGWAEPA